MVLTQIDVINSYVDTLHLLERELLWGVNVHELHHLITRIGNLYTTFLTNGQLALDGRQKGYSVVGKGGERYLVTTVAGSEIVGEVNYTANQLLPVDRISVVFFDIDELEIRQLLDISINEIVDYISYKSGDKIIIDLSSLVQNGIEESRKLVINEVVYNDYIIRELETGEFEVLLYNERVPNVYKTLTNIAIQLGISLGNGMSKSKNTKQLGSKIISTLIDRK